MDANNEIPPDKLFPELNHFFRETHDLPPFIDTAHTALLERRS